MKVMQMFICTIAVVINREALLRANDEVQKLRRDMQRNAAVSAFDQQSRDKEAEAILARNERLEAELQGATLQMQILSAKGVLYDEVYRSLIHFIIQGTKHASWLRNQYVMY